MLMSRESKKRKNLMRALRKGKLDLLLKQTKMKKKVRKRTIKM